MNLQNKTWSKIILIIFFLVTFLIGIYLGINIGKDRETKKERHEPGYSFISPLLECYTEKSDTPENTRIQKKVEQIIDERMRSGSITNASVYFRDLGNGPWFGINEEEKFTPASLLKVSILISYYKMIEDNPELLEKKYLAEDDYTPSATQNITPSREIEIGKEYSVKELLDLMITESSNQATHMLLKTLPEFQIDKTYSDLGIEIPDVQNSENYMSVKDYSSFFRVLYNASYLNKYYSEEALRLLSNSKYKKALVAGLPEGVLVAHKFGEREHNNLKQLHDCGIIYKQDKNYLLCVMTRGKDFNTLSSVIKDISKIVFDNVH